MWGDDFGAIPFAVSENDLNYEMGQRKKRKVTKEEAMLGIFGDSSSEEERPRSEQKPTETYDRFSKKSFSAPIAFVSRGVLDPSSLAQPTTAEVPKREDMPKQPLRAKTPREPATRKQEPKGEQKLADWDVTGKASKMMKLMGYSGGGLGRNGKGIAEAVSAGPVRPKNMGLAFNDYKEVKTELKRDEEVEIMDEEKDEIPMSYWKKSQPKRANKRNNYQLATQAAQAAPVTVIDMTKPLDNLPATKAPYLPELFYNLQTILVRILLALFNFIEFVSFSLSLPSLPLFLS
jgi:hypothetical protein